MTTYEEMALAMLAAFKAQQQAEHAAWLRANPQVAADIRQAAGYEAALMRQAVLNGIPLPAHRRAR